MNERAFLKEHLAIPEAPAHLAHAITTRIEQVALRRIWMEVSLAALGALGVLSYVYASSSLLQQEIQESSFIQFTRLFVSDPDIFLSNIQESVWSFVETIPMQSILLGLGLSLCAVCFVGFVLRLRQVRHQFSLHLT